MSRGLLLPNWATYWGEDRKGAWATLMYKEVEYRFRIIFEGQFFMGSPVDEPRRESFGSDESQHLVRLTKDYWIAETAVTQQLYEAVMGQNPSSFKGEKRPVENVSWEDAKTFIEKLKKETGYEFRLPTEGEWECACRAETTTPFSFGENIKSEQVNFDGRVPYNNGPESTYRQATVDIGTLPSNSWGLYEMHGNVLEWCEDWLGNYESKDIENPIVDPVGPSTGEFRVLRGGSWANGGRNCRSALRRGFLPSRRDNRVGFRLVSGHPREAQ